MPAATCKECGKLFNKVSGDICPACLNAEYEAYIKAKDYMYENGPTTIDNLSEKIKVEKNQLLKMLQSGNLLGIGIQYECSHCKALITNGLLCVNCIDRMKDDLHYSDELRNRQKSESNSKSSSNKTARSKYFYKYK